MFESFKSSRLEFRIMFFKKWKARMARFWNPGMRRDIANSVNRKKKTHVGLGSRNQTRSLRNIEAGKNKQKGIMKSPWHWGLRRIPRHFICLCRARERVGSLKHNRREFIPEASGNGWDPEWEFYIDISQEGPGRWWNQGRVSLPLPQGPGFNDIPPHSRWRWGQGLTRE